MSARHRFLSLYRFLVSVMIVNIGGCPSTIVKKNFDLDKFSGKWYEYQRYQLPLITEKCTTHQFTNETYDITQINITTKMLMNERFRFKLPDEKMGHFQLYKTDSFFEVPWNLQLLETDYDNYAILAHCDTVLNLIHYKNLWVLSRKIKLPKMYAPVISAFVDLNSYNKSKLVYTDQTNCPLDF